MQIKRRFIWAEDDVMGGHGWIPMWIPKEKNFNASEPRGIVHDMLEHAHTDTGTFAQEVIAFGRIIALRLDSGVMSEFGNARPEGLGQELHSIWAHDRDEEDFRAPRVRTMDPHITDTVKRVVSAFAKSMVREYKEEMSDLELCPNYLTSRCTAMANLLQIGYRDALRRYGGDNGCHNIGWAGHGWAMKVRLPTGEDNDILTVTFDTDDCQFKMRQTTRRGEMERFPQWANRARAAWYRS